MKITKVLYNFIQAKRIAPMRDTFKNVIANKLTMNKLDLKDKRILMRVNYDVPIKNGLITNNQRIVQSLESIKYALVKEAKSIVLMSHLGRPNGEKNPKYTLKPIANELKKLLQKDIIFIPDCIGTEVENICKNPPKGSIILLENLRFYTEEEGVIQDDKGTIIKIVDSKIKSFRKNLSLLGDIYINDDFGTIHKAQSSTLGEGFESKAAGFSLSKELSYFSDVLNQSIKPFLLIIGGDKVPFKLTLIKNVLNKLDNIIICGGVAYTFLKILNDITIGNSLFDEKGSEIIMDIVKEACNRNVEIYLPVDFICGTKNSSDAEICNATVQSGIPNGYMGLDIGQESRKIFQNVINNSKFIMCIGPAGVFEIDKFSKGTEALIDAMGVATKNGAISIMAGGNITTSSANFISTQKLSHISLGGSAALKLLEGTDLPGINALNDMI